MVAGDAEVAEALPLGEGVGVAVRHLLEVAAGLLVQAVGLERRHVLAVRLPLLDLLLLGRHLRVDAHVQLEQVVDGVLVEGLFVAVLLKGQGQQTVLLAPVTEVVDTGHIPAGALVEIREEAADDGAAQVAGVEGLGDVGRAELDDHALAALAGVLGIPQAVELVVPELAAALLDHGDDGLHDRGGADEEGHEVARDGGLLEEGIIVGKLVAPLLDELVGLLALDAEGGGGEDEVALVEGRGPLQGAVDDLGVDGGDVGEDVGEVGAVEVEGVELGVAVGVLVGDGVEAHAVDSLGELLHVGADKGRRQAGLCACLGVEGEDGEGGLAVRDGPAACDCEVCRGRVEGCDGRGTAKEYGGGGAVKVG